MRPGFILGFTPSNTVVPTPPPTWTGPISSFEYSEAWAGTYSNPNYPATFTFSPASDQTPLESFEASGGWSGT